VDNLLTALFCTVVSFWIGVIVARIFPHLGMEWGNLAEWAEGLGSIATAFIAWFAFRSWRDPLRGSNKHAAAAEIEEAVRLARHRFFEARERNIDMSEYPPAFHSQREHRSNEQLAEALRHVYAHRYRPLKRQITRLGTLRAKAEVLLNEATASQLRALIQEAEKLEGFFANKVWFIVEGEENVRTWHKKKPWVDQVYDAVAASPDHSDPYSLEFEAKFQALIDVLQRFKI
jgi:hypothetical protein